MERYVRLGNGYSYEWKEGPNLIKNGKFILCKSDNFVPSVALATDPRGVWKSECPSFLNSGICMVILWQDYHGNGNSRKFSLNTVGKKFQIGNAHPSTAKKDDACLCMWTISNWLGNRRTSIRVGKYSWKTLIWENRNRSLTMFIWVALKENVKQAKIWWTIIEKCLNPKSLLELPKSYLFLSNLAQTALHGPMTWKVMQRNAWRDIANLSIKRNKPTTVITGNGTKRTTEHATLNVEDLDMFVTVQLLKDSPAELSLGTLRRTLVFVWIERKSITKFLQELLHLLLQIWQIRANYRTRSYQRRSYFSVSRRFRRNKHEFGFGWPSAANCIG